MKILSVRQPYAELIVSRKKTIELRSWAPTYRGPFLIHASLKPDVEAMRRFGYDSLPCGGIVGKGVLVQVKSYATSEACAEDVARHLVDGSWGMKGWEIEDAQRVPFVPRKGTLGLREYEGNT